MIATDLIHGEAELGDYLFERNALASVAEVLIRGVQGAAVFLGEFLVVVVVDHDFEQRADRAEFGGRQLIEQGVRLLEFLLEIEGHEVYSSTNDDSMTVAVPSSYIALLGTHRMDGVARRIGKTERRGSDAMPEYLKFEEYPTKSGFSTCRAALIQPNGDAIIANAGHPSPHCDGREVETEPCLPLGIAAGALYPESVAQGERFTFVSDGVVEAANAKGELFGFERTLDISSKSAQEIAEAAKAWGQTDDITIVTVRRLG